MPDDVRVPSGSKQVRMFRDEFAAQDPGRVPITDEDEFKSLAHVSIFEDGNEDGLDPSERVMSQKPVPVPLLQVSDSLKFSA